MNGQSSTAQGTFSNLWRNPRFQWNPGWGCCSGWKIRLWVKCELCNHAEKTLVNLFVPKPCGRVWINWTLGEGYMRSPQISLESKRWNQSPACREKHLIGLHYRGKPSTQRYSLCSRCSFLLLNHCFMKKRQSLVPYQLQLSHNLYLSIFAFITFN